MNFDIAIIDGMSRFDSKIHVVIEGAEFADYFWPAVEQYATPYLYAFQRLYFIP